MGWKHDKWLDLIAEVREAGIAVIGADEGTPSEKRWLDAYFTAHLYPVLTPIAIDPAHPFPFIPNRGLCVVVELLRGKHRSQINGLSPIPALVDRFIRLPGEAKRFIRLEERLRLYFAALDRQSVV